MPNIAITNYCNLQCPYCFANEFIESKKQNITDEQLDNILNWLKKDLSLITNIGMIGGEPTIHPKFADIFTKIQTFSKENKLRPPVVFSNGILLGEYAHFFALGAHALINLNSPETIGINKWNEIERSLKKLSACGALDYKQIAFGINLYQGMPDWSYIFETALKYNKDLIRCSLVAPTNTITYISKDDYYEQGKILVLKFLEDAKKYDIKIHFDCNHIPKCYYTEKELNNIEPIVEYWHPYCQPVIDIMPNMQAVACFGVGKPVNIQDFESFEVLRRYFEYKQVCPAIQKNAIGKCEGCQQLERLYCQGGCLVFAR